VVGSGSGPALVLVATPIGNLGDLPPRAVEALKAADVIACEDTRHSRKLLDHAGITPKRLLAVHTHNEAESAARLIASIRDDGLRVAFVTDAGTPGISDPGERLVAAAVDAGIAVELVPGPSAVIAALVLSGLPTARFVFEGFLPRKGRERAERLADLAAEQRTTVLYEAPHRLAPTVADLAEACGGERRIAIARELTKRFEDVWRGTLAEAVVRSSTMEARGEHVLVVEGAPDAPPATEDDVDAAVRRRLDAGLSTKDAAAEVAAALGVPKRLAYNAAVRLSR
jgi:16S rRNA (cytidine1402-2'-O)-methyltransferase